MLLDSGRLSLKLSFSAISVSIINSEEALHLYLKEKKPCVNLQHYYGLYKRT